MNSNLRSFIKITALCSTVLWNVLSGNQTGLAWGECTGAKECERAHTRAQCDALQKEQISCSWSDDGGSEGNQGGRTCSNISYVWCCTDLNGKKIQREGNECDMATSGCTREPCRGSGSDGSKSNGNGGSTSGSDGSGNDNGDGGTGNGSSQPGDGKQPPSQLGGKGPCNNPGFFVDCTNPNDPVCKNGCNFPPGIDKTIACAPNQFLDPLVCIKRGNGNGGRGGGGVKTFSSTPFQSFNDSQPNQLDVEISLPEMQAVLLTLDKHLKVTWNNVTPERFWRKLSESLAVAPSLKTQLRSRVELFAHKCEVNQKCSQNKISAGSDQARWTISFYGKEAAPTLAVIKAFATLTLKITKYFEVRFVCDNSAAETVSIQTQVNANTSLFKLFGAREEYNCIAQVNKLG
jgi:hypothetical protein